MLSLNETNGLAVRHVVLWILQASGCSQKGNFLDDLLNLWPLESNLVSNHHAKFDLNCWLTSKPQAVHLLLTLKTLHDPVRHFLSVRV